MGAVRGTRGVLPLVVTLLVAATGCVAAPDAPTIAPAGAVSPPATAPPPTAYANPVADDVRDPFVLRVERTYYAYGRGTPAEPVPLLRSDDLVHWERLGSALAPGALGAWVARDPAFGAAGVADLGADAGPERYVLYLSATSGATGRSCIGTATAPAPDGPFVAEDEPLLCAPAGVRDPSPVRGSDPLQLAYTVDGDEQGLDVAVLADDGLALASPEPTRVLSAPWGGWQDGILDRPAVVLAPDGTSATLLHGAGDPGGGRAVGLARCPVRDGLVGRCTATPGAPTWIAATDAVASPSGVQVVDDPEGHLWLAYDALPAGSCTDAGCEGTRSLRLDRACRADGVLRTDAPTTGERPLARAAACADDVAGGWAATWASAVTAPTPGLWDGYGYSILDGLADQTLRQVVHTSVGGDEVRVTVSNRFGEQPLQLGGATVAVAVEAAGSGPAVDPAAAAPLRFAGSPQVVVERGETVTSDAVTLAVPADHDLAVSLHVVAPTGPPNGHLWAAETSWVGPGDLTRSAGDGFTTPFTGSAFVSAVDVRGPEVAGAVVVLGDSLTDGLGLVPPDSEAAWPDLLHERLVAAGERGIGVADVGLAGNALLPLSDAASGTNRLDRDVLARAGIRTVVVHLGTNDLDDRQAGEIATALAAIIDRAHSVGVRVVGATIPPVGGPRAGADGPICGAGDAAPAEREATRNAVNARIRPGPGALDFDAVVDLDAVLRDPQDWARVDCPYAGFGLNFHPSLEGHRAMADAVDLATLLG